MIKIPFKQEPFERSVTPKNQKTTIVAIFFFSDTHMADDLVFSSCSWCLSLNPNDSYGFGGCIGRDSNVVKIYRPQHHADVFRTSITHTNYTIFVHL